MARTIGLFLAAAGAMLSGCAGSPGPPLRLSWEKNVLTVRSDRIPGGAISLLYLEAYCRPGSRDRPWEQTVIGHETTLLHATEDKKQITLRCRLKDGVTVAHVITASEGEVDFQLTAHNPTDRPSEAHWAQPCIRVGRFTGTGADQTDDKYAYITKAFVFLDGRAAFMPTRDWATEARYTPGQVWVPRGVPRADANPRPHHPAPPDNGLIGCVSADGKWLCATAWEPYQELFQGVIRCLHSDFRIGGLRPGQSKRIRGKLYVMPNDTAALLRRYRRDFPEQAGR